MEKDRKTKGLAIIAICLAIVGISIGFAAFSTSLSINGSATVKSSSWKIRFENLQDTDTSGTAVELTAPTINTNDTNLGDYSVSFTTPGDSITYTFDVKNAGTFNAKITSFNIPTPLCTGTGSNATTDATNVCDNLEYKLTYSDNNPVEINNTLIAGETKTLKLTLTYKDTITAEKLPVQDVAISNLGITIVYSQD